MKIYCSTCNVFVTTLDVGHYLYFESSAPARAGDKSILETSQYYESGPNCNMTFWYNMNGKDIGSLQVLVKLASGLTRPVWTMMGQQGTNWIQGSVLLSSYHKFTIMFLATRGHGFHGDIALDDIAFHSCAPSMLILFIVHV